MIKGEGNNLGKVEDMGVSSPKKKKTRKEKPRKITQSA